MGLKIVTTIEYQIVKRISLTAMPLKGAGGMFLAGRKIKRKTKDKIS
jgi:hypothetical protein